MPAARKTTESVENTSRNGRPVEKASASMSATRRSARSLHLSFAMLLPGKCARARYGHFNRLILAPRAGGGRSSLHRRGLDLPQFLQPQPDRALRALVMPRDFGEGEAR